MIADCGCHSHNGCITEAGLRLEARLAQQYSLEGLAPRGDAEYVDRVVSVSGLELERDLFVDIPDSLILEQCERFHNGT